MTPLERAPTAPQWQRETTEAMTDELPKPRATKPEELVQLFSGEIWRFVSSQLPKREDAEDVVMEVFAAAFAVFSKVERADDQRLWLLAVARKKVADCLRRQYRRAERPYSEVSEAASAPAASEMQLATRGALERLPDNQREVLVLKYINGLSTEEVGVVIKKSLAATNSLLQRGRQGLREALGPALGLPAAESYGETR
ncbi:RNA polymerase sigma factor [Fimbriimonas ginsengisoli]|nr:sigma-70 family RNA polymerase sigma factor [Fimbriimonas ginsengisoli]